MGNVSHKYKHTQIDQIGNGEEIKVEYELALHNNKPVIHRYTGTRCAQAVDSAHVGPVEGLTELNTSKTITWVDTPNEKGGGQALAKSSAADLLVTDIKGKPLLNVRKDSKKKRWHASQPEDASKELLTTSSVARMFHRIETPSSILVFATSNKDGDGLTVTSVRLPRFNLNFTADSTGC